MGKSGTGSVRFGGPGQVSDKLRCRDTNSTTNMRHALMEMLLGKARPAALRRVVAAAMVVVEGLAPTAATAAAAAAAAQGLAAAAALGPTVAACMCVAEGKAEGRARPRGGVKHGAAQETAPVRMLRPDWCLVGGLCWQAQHGTVCGRI